MKLGLFFDLRNPEPWARPWPEVYGATLDLLERAEALGCEAAWFTEHHLFDDGYLPQPLTFLAAVAARTRRMTIGTAVVLAALRPAPLVAEEAAVVDQLSGGRLELGIGAGYVAREYELYDRDITRRYGLTDAAVAEIRRLLDDGVVTPGPAQRPFPLWLGYQGPQGARRAGRLGVGLLSLDRSLLEPYRDGLVEGGHDPATARTGGLLDIVVAGDPEATLERILPHYLHQANSYGAAAAAGTGREPRVLTAEKVLSRRTGPGSVPGLRVLTPDEAVAAIREAVADSPVEHVYLWASIAAMPDDLVEEHVELLFTQVRPRL
ncbi:LLM class flavin-dependent oxidoreductase [Rhabdothermincola salaria]|uniref:LLM class flavin-dependent oxidoreductase n=1 Tax=Rhabdothermincola salaria TaxID=2903142 RepID=UPI001E37C1DD|nr:LLM class flavin-dependent oxidoreductase [Rhabdothermincola salaria]